MIIKFDFLPISVNSAYATNFNTRRRFKSKPYREFIKHFGHYVPQINPTLLNGNLQLEINLYFPDKRKRDCSNYIKTLEDTLVYYGLIKDDSQITRLVVEKVYDKKKPYTVIEIKSV